MNKDTAKEYLPLVQALAEGKTIEVKKWHQEIINGFGNRPAVVRTSSINEWEVAFEIDTSKHPSDYRIKPEPKKAWYRVGLFKNATGNFYTYSVDLEVGHHNFEKKETFVRWLTDCIEYTLPEGDA